MLFNNYYYVSILNTAWKNNRDIVGVKVCVVWLMIRKT